MPSRRILILILILYTGLHGLYSWATPPYEASDEILHYPMIHYLSENNFALPPMNPDNPNADWRQQGAQPPLYHLLGALLIRPLDLSDLDTSRRVNAHADIGFVLPDGNANMVMPTTTWDGNVIAVYLLRLLSFMLSSGVIVVTYYTARELFPEQAYLWWGSAALTAFLPMFIFVGAAVNNDNLSNLMGNLLVLLLIRLWKAEKRPSWRDYALIGVVVGCGILSKLSIGVLIPFVAVILATLSWRFRDWRPFVVGGAVSGGLTIAIAGWWYWRNYVRYGDPTGLEAFLGMAGRRTVPADWGQIWAERESFLRAWWGFFGGMNVSMSGAVYTVFNLIGGIALLSALAFLLVRVYRADWDRRQWGAVAITLLYPAIAFISYTRWTSLTPASQGRLLFITLSSVSLWMAVGLTWVWSHRLRSIVLTGTSAYFLTIALLAPFLFIRPLYTPPPAIDTIEPAITFHAPDEAGGAIGIANIDVQTPTVHPDEYVIITTDMQIVAPTRRNWSLFVHLLTPEGVRLAQRDMYPGQGLLLTSELEAGHAWENTIAVRIPPHTYAPTNLTVSLGWYHLPTGERMTIADGADMHALDTVRLQTHPSRFDVPSPQSITFNRQAQLIGYDVDTLSVQRGTALDVTFYWRQVRPMREDYVVFAQVVDLATLTRYAASDAMPAEWTRPTTTWEADDIIIDPHTLTIAADTPPGTYALIMGMYRNQDGTITRLPIAGTDIDYVPLTFVRVYD